MLSSNRDRLRQALILFILGFVGILSSLPLIPRLLELAPEQLPISLPIIQLISVVQSSAFLVIMVFLGFLFAGNVSLQSPVTEAWAKKESWVHQLEPLLLPGIIWGVIGGALLVVCFSVFSPHLPSDFITRGNLLAPPWYTKLLYGGITEEILVRWGLMTLFTWIGYRVTQKKGSVVATWNYLIAIFISAILFGILHLPMAHMLTEEPTAILTIYIIVGNSFLGIIAGFLFWKRGLECAIIAHIVAHLTMIVSAGLA